jgi:two-component system, chemotaxis family, chemotaxis protein CheY
MPQSQPHFLPVLVVDDSRTTTAVIRACLEELGVRQIDEVDNGEAALRMIGVKNYGVIISDWHMSPINGPDLLKEVRARTRAIKPKFAFVTMDDRWSNITTARSLGADAFIVKPDNPRTLRSKIGAFMNTRV